MLSWLNYRSGIRVIPSAHIPDGYRFALGNDIFVNPANYEDMRLLSAKEILIALGRLKTFGKVVEEDGRGIVTPAVGGIETTANTDNSVNGA